MFFVKRYFKNLKKISSINHYSRNDEEEIIIKNNYFTVEIMWGSHHMDMAYTGKDGNRVNYSKADIPNNLKEQLKTIMLNPSNIGPKLKEIDLLLYSNIIE